MKVALVIGKYHAFGGGAERWTDRHARYLLRQGIEVHVVAREFADPPADVVCHPISVRRGPGFRLRFAAAIEQFLRSESFDVIHDMGEGWHSDFFMPHHGTRVAGLEQNVKMLPAPIRPIQNAAHRWLPRYREFARLEREQYSLRRPTTFVALSRMVREHMMHYYGVPSNRIELIYNGVDVDRFRPGHHRALRESWGWDDRTIFSLVAHNFRLKGLDALLEAMAILVRRGHGERVGLIVLGSGRSKPYARLARKLGCADQVRFLGNQANPIPYYQASDVYVQPTFYDPCSLVALEALACGLPVITSTMNGAGELITNGVEGYVIDDPSSSEALAERMEEFLKTEFRLAAGQSARRLAEKHSLIRNSTQLIDLYLRLLSSRRAA